MPLFSSSPLLLTSVAESEIARERERSLSPLLSCVENSKHTPCFLHLLRSVMFDGLLGRGGFSSKCKSLIKLTRTRIDVVRRKRNATQKFLKKDIADLLANGLETNAIGRAEGLIAEMCLTSCYDFIDHVCEIILKHLSAMQKNSDCPEDCREAVASLMFSAARFSDLPELRDLRDTFKDRYGNSVDYYVNQQLVEHIAPKPPGMDKKLKLLEDIASEFSITWDRSAFEQSMKAAARADKQKTPAYLHPAENKYQQPHVSKTVQKIENNDTVAKKKIEVPELMKGRDAFGNEQEHGYSMPNSHAAQKSKDANVLPKRREVDGNGSFARESGTEQEHGYSRPNSHAAQKSKDANFLPKRREFLVDGNGSFARENGNEQEHGRFRPNLYAAQKSKDANVLPKRREFSVDGHSSFAPENANPVRADAASPSSIGRADDRYNLTRGLKVDPKKEHHMAAYQVKAEPLLSKGERHVESIGHIERSQDSISSAIKNLPEEETNRLKSKPPPYIKPKKSKHRSRHSESHLDGDINDTLTFGGQNLAPVKDDIDIPHFTVEYYKDSGLGNDPTPRRRSRRRHHKLASTPSDNDDVDEVRVVRRSSTSRRRNESKKGLQILCDDEEEVMDKLLLHYSKKPVGGGEPSEKSRRTKTGSANADGHAQQPSRSISLPHEQSSSEIKKPVFTRAVSLDEDASTPAKHVHPKLPDCDDLAARFAALRRK